MLGLWGPRGQNGVLLHGGPFGGPLKPIPSDLDQQKANTMSQNYDNLVAAVEAIKPDMERAEKGNKAATARVRKAMQEVKALAQELRKEMLELRDAGGAS